MCQRLPAYFCSLLRRKAFFNHQAAKSPCNTCGSLNPLMRQDWISGRLEASTPRGGPTQILLERTPKAQPAEPPSWRKDEYPE
jgi:hypothetical protein